jgi:hypothetical protein
MTGEQGLCSRVGGFAIFTGDLYGGILLLDLQEHSSSHWTISWNRNLQYLQRETLGSQQEHHQIFRN